MLLELRISNFALFDHLQLEFASGFIVLTGETGAGKSLVVDALVLLLGGRVLGDQIRRGTNEASLEATFLISSLPLVQQWLEKFDLATSDSDELLVRRVLSRSGRNRAYINGTATPLHQLQELGRLLLDIHGQHDQQSLLSSRVQLELVDAFGGLGELREAFEVDYIHWQEQQKELEQVRNQSKDRISREEFLQHECDELNKASIETGEDEVLLREHQRLQNSERLSELSNQAYLLLHEADRSLLSQLDNLVRLVQELEKTDSLVKPWLDMLEGTQAQLEEVAYDCRRYRDEIEHDPARLEEIDERLALLQRLKKKYCDSLEGLITRRETIQAELEELTNLDYRLDFLEREVSAVNQQALAKAQTLSQARQKIAQQLEERVKAELSDLKMSHTRFEIRFEQPSVGSTIGASGLDRVEYLFCANPGEALQPLSRVASGGELSRLMLAIKTVLADVDQIPVLVFDEIDTGVGGEVAAGMGQRLRVLGKSHQVLCLTHLPQIASKGTQHFLVEKRVEKKRTTTIVTSLSETARKREIARMLGGEQLTAAVEKAAVEMLNASKEVSR